MKIDVTDSAQFKRLLEALVDELIDARDHFRLHQDLNAAIPDYQAEFNQSAGFWRFTLSAHIDATLLRLCKAYDLYEGKPSLNLRNFLETIQANLHFFDEPNIRERLKDNAFVDSLAKQPRKPDLVQLQKDLESVSKANPLVNKLTIWRQTHFSSMYPGTRQWKIVEQTETVQHPSAGTVFGGKNEDSQDSYTSY